MSRLHRLPLLFLAICTSILAQASQSEIGPIREVHLPARPVRGSFDHFPFAELSARDHYAFRVAPDQSVLVFDSDTNGQWPLVRVKHWWTSAPAQEALEIPGWSANDAKHMIGIQVDVQVTPDGRYAVTFGQALWKGKGPLGHEADTIITTVDLKRWQIVKSIHTANIGEFFLRDARVLNDKWLAFDANAGAHLTANGTDQYLNQLLSIPDLNTGSHCISEQFAFLGRVASFSVVDAVQNQNDNACKDVVTEAELTSAEALVSLIQRGSGIEPKVLKLRDVDWEDYAGLHLDQPRSEGERLWRSEGHSMQFFRDWGGYPFFDLYEQNPPFESSLQLWYGLYVQPNQEPYAFVRYDSQGHKLTEHTASELLCGDPQLGHVKSACGCRVIDVYEARHTLLTFCRQQRGDFTGMVQQEWLSVFHSDDFSAAGLIHLPKSGHVLQALANGENHGYVVTVEHGEVLRVYAIPNGQ